MIALGIIPYSYLSELHRRQSALPLFSHSLSQGKAADYCLILARVSPNGIFGVIVY